MERNLSTATTNCIISSRFYCDWCAEFKKRGSIISNNKQTLFHNNVSDLISKTCVLKNLPFDISMNIRSFLSYNTKNICWDCSNFNITFTKSGRAVKQPRNFQDIKFVKGSGIAGCDNFDHGYDNGHYYNNERFIPDCNLNNFIVNDDDDNNEFIKDDIDLSDNSESEFDFDDTSSDEDSESGNDDEWD